MFKFDLLTKWDWVLIALILAVATAGACFGIYWVVERLG